MKLFWIIKIDGKNKTIPFKNFSREDVKSFMKINNYLNLNNTNWELHQINDDVEKIISSYRLNTNISLKFHDE